jgi:hypothetical protein
VTKGGIGMNKTQIKKGDIVHHKKDDVLKYGEVVKISKTGRAFVQWPVGPKLPFGHLAYYPVDSLIVVSYND